MRLMEGEEVVLSVAVDGSVGVVKKEEGGERSVDEEGEVVEEEGEGTEGGVVVEE